MLFGRLLGQETEYAIRFAPERRHPGNDVIYDAVASAISARVKTEPGLYPERPQIFAENGGAFHYEYLPYCSEGGLIEGATPECRGPAQLLLYQKAQEALLSHSLSDAERTLRASGFPGKLGLLKNCRDAEGHVYGAQESFQATLAEGPGLALYRIALGALLPLLALTVLAGWLVFIGLAILVLAAAVFSTLALALPPFRRRSFFVRLISREDRSLENALGRFLYGLSFVVTAPFIASFSLLLRTFAFRKIRRRATAFLLSRPVLSGAGTVGRDGLFLLSEKGPSIRRILRSSISPNDRAVFDIGNLMKPALAAAHFHLGPMAALFRREQRLQLGLADSSMLQEAEFLKAGSTSLVLSMIEAGALADAPRVKRPIAALRAIVSDPKLETVVETHRGPMTALAIQRFYLERAEQFVRDSKATSLEALQVVSLWRELLGALERREISSLVGRIDWVTKRYLLETCGDARDSELLKTIDLRYHELHEGYAAKLEERGWTRRIVGEAEVERATSVPPAGTPAFTRGRFIRTREANLSPVRISWDSARIGGRLHGRVVRFPADDES
ncbi:MAG: proteasome accessory factor PafA2 family protein [Vicinamibacteria bacterium]